MIIDRFFYFLAATVIGVVVWSNPTVDERVDMVELNHFHDSNGKFCFSQVIFWRWDHVEGNYHVGEWRMIEGVSINPRPDKCTVKWKEHSGIERLVIAKHFRESWTQIDPERMDKNGHPESERIGLISRNRKTTVPSLSPEIESPDSL